MKKTIVSILVCLVMMALCTCALAEAQPVTYESRGVKVKAMMVVPDGPDSYPVVILAHGHGGSRDEAVGFSTIAYNLALNGIASLRMDFSGCGESTESFQQNCLTNMKADVLAGLAYVKANYPVTTVGLFGYSMGGRIALELLAEGIPFDAVVLLAPAADTADLKNLFGGAENYDAMYETAKIEGFSPFDTIYGQHQELSAQWFSDLDVYEDVKASAAEAYKGPALVIWALDDAAVSPSVSQSVAEALNAQTVNTEGDGHSYGFYDDRTDILEIVVTSTVDFYKTNLMK